MLDGLAPDSGRLQWQHDAQLAEQAADAIDQRGALFDIALARTMHEQARLLLDAFDRHKTHIGAGHGFADGRSIGGVVLAALAAHAIGHNELGRHQAHDVAELGELSGPVVGSAARFHADQARRQIGNEFE